MSATYIGINRVSLSDGSNAYDLKMIQDDNVINFAINSESESKAERIKTQIVKILKTNTNEDIVECE